MTRRDHSEGGDNAAFGAATDVKGSSGADEDREIRALSDRDGGEWTAEVNCLLPAPVEQSVAEQLRVLDDEWFATVIVANQRGDVRPGLRSGVQSIGRAMSDDPPIGVGEVKLKPLCVDRFGSVFVLALSKERLLFGPVRTSSWTVQRVKIR
jgi:hypothetical protein